MKKTFSLTLILIFVVSSLLIVQPAFAPSIHTLPSAPTVTVTLTNASYYLPTTYFTDPQTGANITKAGSFVNAENLTFTIQNQPNVTYYVIRWMTPHMNGWSNIEGNIDGFGMNATLASSSGSTTTWVLTGTYDTFLLYSNEGQSSTSVDGYSFVGYLNLESGATIEFQVQACNGYPEFYAGIGVGEGYSIIGEVSNWSNTQTITIPETSNSAPPSPTPPSSYVPEFSWIEVLPILVSTIALAVILKHQKVRKLS
jgi:hypothetical protein